MSKSFNNKCDKNVSEDQSLDKSIDDGRDINALESADDYTLIAPADSYSEALDAFNAMEIHGDPNENFEKGNENYQLKEYEIAAYYYKIALTVTPDYVTSLSNLAYLYQSQNQIDNLQPIYKQLAVLDPNSEKTAEINNYLSKRLKNSE